VGFLLQLEPPVHPCTPLCVLFRPPLQLARISSAPSGAWSVPLIALLSLLSRNWTVPRATHVRAPPMPASKPPAPLTLLGRVG